MTVEISANETELMRLQQWCIDNCAGDFTYKTLGAVDRWGSKIRYAWNFTLESDFVQFSLIYG
jgi:hypothetical protein